MSDEKTQTLKKTVVLSLLQGDVKRYRSPQDDLVVKFLGIDSMQEGEISINEGTTRIPWADSGKAVIDILQEELGIKCLPSVDKGHSGDALAWVERKHPESTLLWDGFGAAPWYIQWRLDSGLVEPSIRSCLQTFVQWLEPLGRFVFRGEDALYSKLLSGFARKWETNHPLVIEQIAKTNLNKARSFVKAGENKLDDEAIWAAIQHKGGVTNKVDFSKNIWIALYFAVQGQDDRPGRLWALDVVKAANLGIMITEAAEAFDPTACRRAENQRGVLVESKSGEVPVEVLSEVVQVPGSVKKGLRSFLEEIGVTEVALFADIDAFISGEQEMISLEGVAILWLDRIRKGEWKRVLAEAEHLLNGNYNDPHRNKIACYCGAMAAAKGGNIQLAWKLIKRAKDAFRSENVPLIMKRNQEAIQEAARSGDAKRLAKRLDLLLFEELWSVQFTGFKFKAVPSLEEAIKMWAHREKATPLR